MGKSGDKQRRIANKWDYAGASGTIKIEIRVIHTAGQIGIYGSVSSAPKNRDVFISCVRTRNEPKKASGGGVVRKVFRSCGF